MNNLPKSFPKYCIDLKQILDEKQKVSKWINDFEFKGVIDEDWITNLKYHHKYPKQTNEHNALADAKWNFELYKFLNNI